jgi:hypothetical protein
VERFRKSRLLLGALSGILLFQFALMLAMAAWEPLHHDLHCDAGHPDHQCEVTLWRNGAANDTPPPLAVPRPAPVLTPPDVPRHHAPPALTATHLLGGVLAQSPLRGP